MRYYIPLSLLSLPLFLPSLSPSLSLSLSLPSLSLSLLPLSLSLTHTCSLSTAPVSRPSLLQRCTVLGITWGSQTSSRLLPWQHATLVGTSNTSSKRHSGPRIVYMPLPLCSPLRYAVASCSERRDKVVHSRIIVDEEGVVIRREEDSNPFPSCLIAGSRQITWTNEQGGGGDG